MIGRLLCLLTIALGQAGIAGAQAPSPPDSPSRGFEILDNSFLVEEAFNQEAGIFQNIVVWSMDRHRDWIAVFTQEWPFTGQAHQLSYTVPFGRVTGDTHFGDVLLNYRYQLLAETPGRPALAPRVSVVLPTSNAVDDDGAGLQLNIPVSKQHNDLYFHWNAGLTWFPRAPFGTTGAEHVALTTPQIAASGIWRVTPTLNLMLEALMIWDETIESDTSTRHEGIGTISPGFRYAWNIGDTQVVFGAAAPINFGSETAASVLTYFSYELPFR